MVSGIQDFFDNSPLPVLWKVPLPALSAAVEGPGAGVAGQGGLKWEI